VTPSFDAGFWAAFWPAVVSTLIGVALGLPVGLFLNGFGLRASGRAERKAQHARLVRALRVINGALATNEAGLTPVASLTPGQFVTSPGANSAVWDAVKGEVIPNLHDPELQGLLADYFAEVDVVLRLNDRYLDHMIGVTSALGGAAVLQETIRQHLMARATKTVAAGQALRARLGAHLME
jgi:hypothetical protein